MQTYSQKSEPIPNSYKLQVKLMIESNLRGCLLPQMEPAVLKQHVEDWSATFHSVIPEDCLNMAYMAAKRNPDRRPEDARFPIKDTEVLQAWYRIKAKESAGCVNECDFCRLNQESPGRYKPCPFHPNSDGKQEMVTTTEDLP